MAQIGFKDEIQGRVTRFVKAVDEDISNEQIQECIHNPEQLQEILESKVIKSNSSKMKYALEDIQEKYHDIIRLEKVRRWGLILLRNDGSFLKQSVREMTGMFEDCKMLLFEQGENLDLIDVELEKAQNYTKKAVKRLVKQKEDHKKIRSV